MATSAAAVTTGASFSDDVLREILVRLEDAADLLRCAVTCKRWRGLVVKASFLRRRRWPDHTSMFFSGFFVWEEAVLKKDPTYVTSFIPTSRSVFGSKPRSLMSFFPKAARTARGMVHNALPLAMRHGLLLVRLGSPNSSDVIVHLAVCNLLVGACHKLPPLQCNWKFDKSGYAILTSEDCFLNAKQQPFAPQGYSAFFKVLIIGNDTNQQPQNLHKFTSGETRWRGPSKFTFAAKEMIGCVTLRHSRAVVWHGTAHWLVRYPTSHSSSWHTIDVDAGTCCVSLTEIKTPVGHDKIHSYHEAQLTVAADGKLSLFHMQSRGNQLDVWTRHEDGGYSRWLCAPVIDLNPLGRKNLLMLGEKGGMLLVKDNHGNVYTVDLESGEMEEVAGFDRINRRQIVPFEMDWPTFFVSRLGSK
ncbi:unnamed protein product [Alopecurus aequalis]